jgi:hypothetical protein
MALNIRAAHGVIPSTQKADSHSTAARAPPSTSSRMTPSRMALASGSPDRPAGQYCPAVTGTACDRHHGGIADEQPFAIAKGTAVDWAAPI